MGGYISFVPVENGTPVVASGVDPFPVTLETSKVSSLFSEVLTVNRTPSLHTAAETAVETDVSATAISGGIVVWSDLVVAGQANKSVFNSSDLNFDLPQTQPVSLCIRTLSGTGTADVHFRLREEW